MTTTLTDNELRVLRREVIDEVVRDRGRKAATDLLDELAEEARDELEGAELSSVLEEIQEEVRFAENIELGPEPPEDPCDEEFMEEISS